MKLATNCILGLMVITVIGLISSLAQDIALVTNAERLSSTDGHGARVLRVQSLYVVTNAVLLIFLPLGGMLYAVKKRKRWGLIVSLILLSAYAIIKALMLFRIAEKVARAGYLVKRSTTTGVSYALDFTNYVGLFMNGLGAIALCLSIASAIGIYGMLRKAAK
jgi:hypothetical protein